MENFKGSCHCGEVQFEVSIDLKDAISCNCSMCQRKGSLLSFVPESQFALKSGESVLTDYQFGRKTIHHTFCSICGVTSFASGQKPDGTKMKAINVRCLEGIDLEKLKIKHFDGRSL